MEEVTTNNMMTVIKDLRNELDVEKGTVEDLKTQLIKKDADYMQLLDDLKKAKMEVNQVADDKEKLQRALEASEEANTDLNTKKESFVNQLKTARKETSKAIADKTTLMKDKVKLEVELDKVTKERNSYEERNKEIKARNAKLDEENTRLRREREAMQEDNVLRRIGDVRDECENKLRNMKESFESEKKAMKEAAEREKTEAINAKAKEILEVEVKLAKQKDQHEMTMKKAREMMTTYEGMEKRKTDLLHDVERLTKEAEDMEKWGNSLASRLPCPDNTTCIDTKCPFDHQEKVSRFIVDDLNDDLTEANNTNVYFKTKAESFKFFEFITTTKAKTLQRCSYHPYCKKEGCTWYHDPELTTANTPRSAVAANTGNGMNAVTKKPGNSSSAAGGNQASAGKGTLVDRRALRLQKLKEEEENSEDAARNAEPLPQRPRKTESVKKDTPAAKKDDKEVDPAQMSPKAYFKMMNTQSENKD